MEKNITIFKIFPAQRCDLEPIHERLLMGVILANKDHADFKRMAMNDSFPRTKNLIQSVQRQLKMLIERNGAYNLQIFQDWNAFRCQELRC